MLLQLSSVALGNAHHVVEEMLTLAMLFSNKRNVKVRYRIIKLTI
jgi:hypothetical protein